MWGIIFSVSIVWIPGLVAYWGARQLMGCDDDPVFANRLWRYRKRVAFVAWLTVFIVMWTAGAHALWLLPLLLLAAMRGGYPLRRKIFDESWSFLAYASFTLRLSLGVGAYWIVLLATPWLGEIVPHHALAIALAASILIATKALSRQLLARLLALEPWRPEEGEMSADLARIHSEARVSRPKAFRLPVEGGSWVNALAMPSIRDPWVVLSGTLLQTFEPSELAAIYAHELAHLEEMDSAWCKRRELLEWGLVALAIAVTAYGSLSSGELPVQLGWSMVLLFGLARFQAASRGREDRADRRAVELLGSSEALQSALLKLHASSRMPRRWGWEEAKRLSHPSLARRLQSIRSFAAERTAALGEAPIEPPVVETLVVVGNTEGNILVLDQDHVRRLTGVPVGAGGEAQDVLDAASAVSSDRYDGLTELRLEPWSVVYRLVGRPLHGRRWTFTLPTAGANAVQRHLDRVDHHLAAPPDRHGFFLPNATIRMLAGLAVLMALFPGFYFSVAIVALAAAILPASAILAAAGSMGIAASLHALLLSDGSWLPLGLDAFQGWPLMVASIPLILAARTERAGDPEGIVARRTGVVLLLFALPFWAVLTGVAAFGVDPPDAFAMHRLARSLPVLFLLPIGAAAAFALGKTRSRKWMGFASSTLAIAALFFASPFFQMRFAVDPMRILDAPTPRQAVLNRTNRIEIQGQVVDAKLAPDGASFAVTESYDVPTEWRLGNFDEGLQRTLEAHDLTMLSGGRWIYVQEVANDSSHARLCRGSFDDESEECGAVFEAPTSLSLVTNDRTSWIWGLETGAGGDLAFQITEVDRDGRVVTNRLESERESEVSFPTWNPLTEQSAIAVHWVSLAKGDASWFPFWPIFKYELRRIGPGESSELFLTRLSPRCLVPGPRRPGSYCTAQDGRDSYLWWIPPAGPPEPLARFRADEWSSSMIVGDDLLVESFNGPSLRIDPEANLTSLPLPEGVDGDLLAAGENTLLFHLYPESAAEELSEIVLFSVEIQPRRTASN